MTLGAEHDALVNLERIRATIEAACDRSGRDASDVLLVAAAKTAPPELVQLVVDAGVGAVGENYVRELRDKRRAVRGTVRWHFLGTLQTNTAHHVAALADVVETLSSEHATTRLARRAAEAGRTLEALIEVDFTGERAGVAPEETLAYTHRVVDLEGIDIVGLMTLPPLLDNAEDARPWFVKLRDLRDRVREKHPQVLELSMGMSLDYAVAVEEGATMVRIGTALFGPRS
ncbi:MAG: YggS family pyridoxal phosphate-dependent enzyme [Actinomycetota bacterium]|nr:YggS family pyridoxal phosphate-dependent enzyme [Actinomycetota bacterium]